MKNTKKAVKKAKEEAKVIDEVFEKLKKQNADNMKSTFIRPKDEVLPDMVNCQDCGKEVEKHFESHKCPDCNMILCGICSGIHKEEHLAERYEEEEEEEERTNKPQWQ